MSDKTRESTGVRLPLFLLIGFLALVGGVAVWLEISPPVEPQVPPTKPVAQTLSLAPESPAATAAAPTAEPSPPGAPPAHPETTPSPASPVPDNAAAAAAHSAGAARQTAVESRPVEPPPDERATPNNKETPEKSGTNDDRPQQPAAALPRTVTPPSRPTAAKNSGVQIARLPPVDSDPPLKAAPDPDLVQETTIGPLPQKSSDGRVPWQVYAKPFNRADRRPRIAIVVTGLGLSAAATESAIQGLPGSVTLAFAPYASDLNGWIRLARAAGHEVLLNVPMEPVNYPAYDPGPQTLLTSLNEQGNMDRLLWILSRGSGYVGIIDFMGSRFTASAPHLTPVLTALRDRGLLYLDSGSATRSSADKVAPGIGLPWAATTVTLDERASRTEIDRRFAELEQAARDSNRAIGIASPYPVSLERIATWSRQLAARGIAVAPVSAMVHTNAGSSGN